MDECSWYLNDYKMWSPPNIKTVGWTKSMKIFFGATLFVVLLIFILFILQQTQFYYSKLVWGTIIVIVGSSVSQLLPERKRYKRLKLIRVLCLAIFIAVGTLLTTQGWNERTVGHQKKGIIRSVAAELMININIWKDSTFTETDDEKLKKYVVFPRMQTTVLASALSSGLFNEEKDLVFLTRAANLNENLLQFNNRLSITEDMMATSPGRIYKLRKMVRDSNVRKSIGVKLHKFGILLLSDYCIKSDEKFFVNLDE